MTGLSYEEIGSKELERKLKRLLITRITECLVYVAILVTDICLIIICITKLIGG